MMTHLLLESVIKLLDPSLVQLAETLGNRDITAASDCHTSGGCSSKHRQGLPVTEMT